MREVMGDVVPSQRGLIIASNRGPVTFEYDQDHHLQYQRGSGGLVTALTGLVRYVEATWISCAQTEADIEWGSGKVSLTEEGEEISVRFLNPSPKAYDQYYNVISNPLLWFLQHSMWDVARNPIIDLKTWQAWEEGYVNVNQLFSDAVAESAGSSPQRCIIMLQDYHLYLTARMIRNQIRRRLRPTITHFVHVPWPGPEYWGILPPTMRQAILDGLCGADLIGFQTREDGLNFIRTCESYLPSARVGYTSGRINYRKHTAYIRDFPISIDVDSLKQLAASDEVAELRLEIKNIVQNCKLILRIDRIEPSKNIVRGFQAFEELLDLHPEYHEKVKFLALLVPSRMEVDEYQNYLNELMALSGQVNAKFGSSTWEPIRVLVGENYPRAVAALQLYDVLLVNSIADGMNLVAKEGPVVNLKNGVLILSERTGAHQQLEPGALVISPTDIYSTAQALHQSLEMPVEERRERSTRLKEIIEREDIAAWMELQLNTIRRLKL